MTESTAAATPKIVTPLNVEEAVRNRYSGAAQAQEAALCCPVDYDAKYLEIIPPEACVEIATMVLERLCGQAGQPSLYTAIDCLLNDMDAFHIAKRHLEARTKARAANPNKGETRTGRRHRKKMMTSHVAPTVGNPKRQEKESDEKVVERLTKAKKSHRQIMIERERLRSREAEEARAKQADGVQQRQRQKLEEAEAAKAKKARADQARKATVESGKARMKKMNFAEK